MRVIMVDPNSDTPYYDLSLCLALRKIGCDVELVTSQFAYEDVAHIREPFVTQHFYRAISSRAMGRFPWHRSRLARRAIKGSEHPVDVLLFLRHVYSQGPDLVHYQWAPIAAIDYVAFRVLHKMRVPVVYTIHDLLAADGAPLSRLLAASLYRGADLLIAHSEWTRAQLLARFGAPHDRIRVVPIGDVDLCADSGVSREEARRRLGLPIRAPVALFFGIIRPNKGLHVLIRAFASVKRAVADAILVIAGRPSEPFAAYQAIIDELGISSDVRLDLRFLPTADAALYFTAADVVVLPYLQTTTSAVLPMAYTFGRPVVATTAGGMPEAVVHGRSGYLVSPGDHVALADRIAAILSDEETWLRMGAYARRLARDHHSWANIARATVSVYGECLASAAGS